MRLPASISALGRASYPAGRGPNSSSLFPPLAAVGAVALSSASLMLRSLEPTAPPSAPDAPPESPLSSAVRKVSLLKRFFAASLSPSAASMAMSA